MFETSRYGRVSAQVEAFLYERAKEIGRNFNTVRKGMFKFQYRNLQSLSR